MAYRPADDWQEGLINGMDLLASLQEPEDWDRVPAGSSHRSHAQKTPIKYLTSAGDLERIHALTLQRDAQQAST